MVEPEPLDLTNEQPAEDQLITLRQTNYIPLAQAETLEMTRERMRGVIALSLVMVLVVIVLFTLFMVFILSDLAESLSETLQAVGTTVLSPIIGLIGAVTGFYFGGQRAGAQTPPPRDGDSR
jgi:hypothetical protein